MHSNSKDNGFCNSATPIPGIFEGIIDFFKGDYCRSRWVVQLHLCNYECLPAAPFSHSVLHACTFREMDWPNMISMLDLRADCPAAGLVHIESE